MNLNKIKIAPSRNYHLGEGGPLYEHRFDTVLKFHEPGLAPVQDSTGAFHITIKGIPAYSNRFQRTFGFYEGLAAVESEEGWYHIQPSGESAYAERYTWCGNFQEGYCAVRDQDGLYFHITQKGMRLSTEAYHYVGDFKEGMAVVCHQDGLSTHIDEGGLYIHHQWFQQLDVYHKGFARARDLDGWFHIDLKGQAVYSERYRDLEPFYNGVAHGTDKYGQTLLINEEGHVLQLISKNTTDYRGQLSGDLVGFWKSEIIRVAVESKLLDHLPASIETLVEKTAFPEENLRRFLRALSEVGIVIFARNKWVLSQKGQYLVPTHQSSMAASAIMWHEVQKQWQYLELLLKKTTNEHHLTFKEEETDPASINIYQRAVDGYAHEDFQDIAIRLPWSQHESILGLGRASITILPLLLEQNSFLKGCVLNANYPLFDFDIPRHLKGRLKKKSFQLDGDWPSFSVDAILLPRYLHYFPDNKALSILKKLKQHLSPRGNFYIFEMILSDENPAGGLLDMNMLVESGGGLRTLKQWAILLSSVGLKIQSTLEQAPHLHIIIGVSDE